MADAQQVNMADVQQVNMADVQQVNMADGWMKFSFTVFGRPLQVQDTWKDGEFSKWMLLPLEQKSLQELAFKAFENQERSGCVDCQ